MKVYVCSRFTYHDFYLLEHFIKHYKTMGVYKILMNLNYKLEEERDNFNSFVEFVTVNYANDVIFNIGPNCESLNETSNIDSLKKLVVDNTNIEEDFIIPADSDEFVLFQDTLMATTDMMNRGNISHIQGCTNERISKNGDIISVENDKPIFSQFPNCNDKLFCQPKIALIRAKYFKYTGVGHHNININLVHNLEDKLCLTEYIHIPKLTNHFRWNAQGRLRMQNWVTLWSKNNYCGWKDIDSCIERLKAMDGCLLDYK